MEITAVAVIPLEIVNHANRNVFSDHLLHDVPVHIQLLHLPSSLLQSGIPLLTYQVTAAVVTVEHELLLDGHHLIISTSFYKLKLIYRSIPHLLNHRLTTFPSDTPGSLMNTVAYDSGHMAARFPTLLGWHTASCTASCADT